MWRGWIRKAPWGCELLRSGSQLASCGTCPACPGWQSGLKLLPGFGHTPTRLCGPKEPDLPTAFQQPLTESAGSRTRCPQQRKGHREGNGFWLLMAGLKHPLSTGTSLLPFLVLLSVPLWMKEQTEKSHSRGDTKLWLISHSPWRSLCSHSPVYQAVQKQTAWIIMSLSWWMFTNCSEIFSSRCCKRTKCIETQTWALTLYLPWDEGWNRDCEKWGLFLPGLRCHLEPVKDTCSEKCR